MPPALPMLDHAWRPPYWKPSTHGVAWDRIRPSVSVDWVEPASSAEVGTTWAVAEPGFRYGFGAQLEYGSEYAKWSDELERRLAFEWSEERTGQTFAFVRPFVRQGFEARR